MVGLICDLLLNFVERNCGAGAVAEVRGRAGVPEGRVFRMDTVYEDEEFQRLLAAAAERMELTTDALEASFARYAGEALKLRFPGFWAGATSTREMLLRQPRIHNAMTSSARDTTLRARILDKFRIVPTPDGVVLHYSSPNQLCVFYRHMVAWLAEQFGEEAESEERRCLKRGADRCEIHVRLRPRAEQ